MPIGLNYNFNCNTADYTEVISNNVVTGRFLLNNYTETNDITVINPTNNYTNVINTITKKTGTGAINGYQNCYYINRPLSFSSVGFSISFWLYTIADVNDTVQTLFVSRHVGQLSSITSENIASLGNPEVELRISTDGRGTAITQFVAYSRNSPLFATGSYAITRAWNHISFVQTFSTQTNRYISTLYLNGISIAVHNTNSTNSFFTGKSSFSFMGYVTGANTITRAVGGILDNIQIYSRALTLTEVQTIASSTTSNF
jgi:hypothetical protein